MEVEGADALIPSLVSVPSFGDSFFIDLENGVKAVALGDGFRPLIRGFFFYEFLMKDIEFWGHGSFRPLIRGFFFYILYSVTLFRS